MPVSYLHQRSKQGVTLLGRNTTGPPRAAPWYVTLHMRRVTDNSR